FDLLKADKRFLPFDLYSVAYDSHQPGPTVSDVLDRLEQVVPSTLARYEETYLIAHSLGGIVTQKLIRRLYERSNRGFPGNLKLVIFLATPGQADFRANLMAYVATNPLWGYLGSKEFVEDTVHEWLRVQHQTRSGMESVCATERLGL